ncbi:MAG: T9SS type A sorting domain-containing protein [Fluviicola sp.]
MLNKISHLFIIVFTMVLSYSASAQFGFEFDNSVPVVRNGQPISNAWGGGLNYPQISDFDYDFDGDLDLFVFDRSNDNIRVYSQENNGQPYYELVYNAANLFPSGMRYRAALVDYDNDGRKDLWTYGIGGLKIYRNVGNATNGLQWELVTDLLYSEYVNGQSQLYVSSADIPAIIDVDGDGDIDVLTFNQGGETVEYHQNQSMELYGIPDSLVFELKNQCWGLFREDFNTNVISLNDQDVPCVGGGIPNPLRTNAQGSGSNVEKKHAGSTLLAIDIDNSGVLDLILGDVSYSTMTLLMNGGSQPNTNSAMVSQDNFFPSNTTPVDIELFPAGFYLDVDFDGVKDLLVCPNARNISENETSVRFFKNMGTNANPNFVYSSPNFFQEDMIEHGTGTIPILFDVNEDGLKDLIIPNYFRYIPTLSKECTFAYYRNTGTANAPEYTYVDYNYLDLDQQNYGLRTVPTFGDIDGDGDEDLLMGLQDGTMVYYENTSTGSGAQFNTPVAGFNDNTGTPIETEGFAYPQFFDLDNDNLLDLILGTKDGHIEYYRNIGTSTNPSFELANEFLGNIDLTISNPNTLASPHFFRVGDTTHLFAGSADGTLVYYDSIHGQLDPGEDFHLVSTNYLGINVEAYSTFWVEDIDNDGNLNMFVGQDLGGLFHFEADPNSSVSLSEFTTSDVVLYPNPGNQIIHIRSDNPIEDVQILNMQGQVLLTHDANKTSSLELDVNHLPIGTYVVMIRSNTGIATKKWVKL